MVVGVVWTVLLPALALPAASRRAALATGSMLLLQPLPASSTVAGDREVVTTIEVVAVKGKPPVKVTRPRLTGAGDPAWTFGQRDISSAIYAEPFPAKFPYAAADFKRLDEAPDTEFYKFPKLVYHIDEGAVSALTRYYDAQIPDGSDVLDICSSWVSHFPRDFPTRMKSLVGVGISEIELACNDQLSRHVAQDLNKNPKLPFPDRSFDCVTCVHLRRLLRLPDAPTGGDEGGGASAAAWWAGDPLAIESVLLHQGRGCVDARHERCGPPARARHVCPLCGRARRASSTRHLAARARHE